MVWGNMLSIGYQTKLPLITQEPLAFDWANGFLPFYAIKPMLLNIVISKYDNTKNKVAYLPVNLGVLYVRVESSC